MTAGLIGIGGSAGPVAQAVVGDAPARAGRTGQLPKIVCLFALARSPRATFVRHSRSGQVGWRLFPCNLSVRSFPERDSR